jgi:hypothetical protein
MYKPKSMEYISTSALANELDMKSSELFDKLKTFGWVDKKNDKWILTDLGKQKGGQTRINPKFGEYVVWPENISIDDGNQKEKSRLLNATAIGKHFGISSQRLNLILSELGWIQKNIAGWDVTKLGRTLGGKQFEADQGFTYVIWSDSILQNKNLTGVFKEFPSSSDQNKSQQTEKGAQHKIAKPIIDNFREKFPATFRTKDGHMVRSRAEVIIDNALYDYKLAHAYERKLPIEEDLYADFFIPSENVYIEFWGMEDDAKYVERKNVKIEIYKKYDFKLIELNDSDISNLDDHLPKKLLKYGIKVY